MVEDTSKAINFKQLPMSRVINAESFLSFESASDQAELNSFSHLFQTKRFFQFLSRN